MSVTWGKGGREREKQKCVGSTHISLLLALSSNVRFEVEREGWKKTKTVLQLFFQDAAGALGVLGIPVGASYAYKVYNGPELLWCRASNGPELLWIMATLVDCALRHPRLRVS